jgi:hypothetical protein
VESNGAKIIMTIRWSIVEKWRRPLRGFPGMDLNAIDFTHSDTFKASIWGGVANKVVKLEGRQQRN